MKATNGTFDLPEGLILTSDQQDMLKIDGKIIRVVPAWHGLKNCLDEDLSHFIVF